MGFVPCVGKFPWSRKWQPTPVFLLVNPIIQQMPIENKFSSFSAFKYNECAYGHAKLLWLCPTPCDPIDCGPPHSSVHGILQARVPDWVALSSSRGSS